MDGALVWDKVPKQPHGAFIGASSFLKPLIQRHRERISNNPDFQFMREQVAELEKRREKNQISLREETLKQERTESEAWQLESENRRRAKKGLEPISKLSDLEDELEKDAQGRPINPQSEAMLEESGRILMDMVVFTQKFTAARQ